MNKDQPKGSFIRWQSITIGQLTYAINLVLGFSVATLGFQVSLLLNEKFKPIGGLQKLSFFASLILLVLSVAFGIWVVINRLEDFRETTKAARKRENGAPGSEIEPHRIRYQKLGKRTWCIFWCQIITFGLGVALTILSVFLSAIHKVL